jgi:hypothetical protein
MLREFVTILIARSTRQIVLQCPCLSVDKSRAQFGSSSKTVAGCADRLCKSCQCRFQSLLFRVYHVLKGGQTQWSSVSASGIHFLIAYSTSASMVSENQGS